VSTAADKALPYLISALFIGAVVSPYLESEPKDSFPLSTYPMFSFQKDRKATLEHVVGLTPDGRELFIPPRLIANDEVLQARATIHRTVRRGRLATRKLCAEVAERLRGESGELGTVTTVEVRRATYDSVEYFTKHAPPTHSKVFARCPVTRR